MGERKKEQVYDTLIPRKNRLESLIPKGKGKAWRHFSTKFCFYDGGTIEQIQLKPKRIAGSADTWILHYGVQEGHYRLVAM